jgi:cell division protein FtsI (penicillin-binding protein 3)
MKKAKKGVTFNHNPLLRSELVGLAARASCCCASCWRLLALIGRAAYLQGVNDQFLQAKGESRYARVLDMPATRGKITDRQGDVLAVSSPVKSVWAIPEDARLTRQTRQLAVCWSLPCSELNQKLSSDKDFVYLKRQVSPELADRIAALKLPGIHDQREYRRYYPGGDVMAHVLGFTGVDDKGQEGIELAFEAQLAGKPGSRRVIKDRRGRVVEDVSRSARRRMGARSPCRSTTRSSTSPTRPQAGHDDHKAKAGGVVVLDAKTGEVLALANAPTYNPNNRVKLTGEQLRNRAADRPSSPARP